MTVGNVFQLIINDGVQDKLFQARTLLEKTIKKAMERRLNDCIKMQDKDFIMHPNKYQSGEYQAFRDDPSGYCKIKYPKRILPSAFDIKKTHGVYINSCYKPYVPFAYTYVKATERRGKPLFDGEVVLKVEFPFTVTKIIVDKLIKGSKENISALHNLYV